MHRFQCGNGQKSVRRADNLTTFMCQMSRNSGPSTSWNPKGLSRPVTGKLYLLMGRNILSMCVCVCRIDPFVAVTAEKSL
jgi:hypothetical protein